ncbi:MAG: tRNA 2-thiouridine(34) synthase MnmA, partial [Prevotella sp.]|nr:tRNA 2-thiouridine(34) synthase MnmA [Prevotella sp.]
MILEELANKRIAVLLSGGVDSSVVLYELVRQGLQPDCFYIKIGPEEEEEWDCSSEEDLEMATAVSHKYGCRLEVIDCHQEYWDQVTRYTMEKVKAGMTPNPDVMCNRLIKFGAFHEKCGHDYDLIATGHYATTETEEIVEIVNRKSVNRKLKWLCTSPDPVKDQTDFLAQIYDWQLQKALFPIGHMMKEEVRAIAEREHLVNAKRKDSQGICFLGKINYNDYLRRYLGEMPGDVIELETGRKIGQHKGHWFHTIGQRKGMGFGGGPWFVVKKDIQQNIIYVSHGYDPQTA